MTRLSSDTRGAAMVFGIFFAVLLVGMVWYLVGLSETLGYRQEVQDAADAGAFSAAVVNARGMNLIALINMTMAAVLSVLVGLRLATTLGLVALGICYGLAWITGGASMTPVPLISSATRTAHKAAAKVEKQIPKLLGPLHMAGKAVSVVVPVGANLRVIDTVLTQYDVVAGFAIPARFTLPVEDDDFTVLCEHAGKLAGQIALFPISPLLPDKINQKISGATGKLAASGSSWFCGGSGDPPDLNDDEDTQVIEYPIMPRQKRCTELVERSHASEAEDANAQAEIERVCAESGVEYLASLPNRQGECRSGQPLCPTDCEESSRASCPPAYFQDCSPKEAEAIDALAPDVIGSHTVTCGAKKQDGRFDYSKTSSLTAYERRLIAAREQCDPSRPENRDKRGYFWLQRSVVFSYQWKAGEGWSKNLELSEFGDQELVQHENDDDTRPCDDADVWSEYEGKELRSHVCHGEQACLTAEYSPALGEGRCDLPPAPGKGEPTVARERVTQITDIVRCAKEQDLTKVAVERMDVTESLKKDKKNGGDNTSPFRLEKGVWLGGSDFQLRAVVVGHKIPDSAQEVIKIASWNQPRDDASTASEVADVAEVVASIGRLGLAQAEYYFDWTTLDPKPDDQLKDADVTEWLWHMGWKARLRPFRFNHSKADGPRPKGDAGPDPEQQAIMPSNLPAAGELVCKDEDDGCGEAQQVIDIFGDGES